jgi:hypothetical protein
MMLELRLFLGAGTTATAAGVQTFGSVFDGLALPSGFSVRDLPPERATSDLRPAPNQMARRGTRLGQICRCGA